MNVRGTTVQLVHGDLTDEAVDAIVNAANTSLLGGGGVDGAIHRKGGPEILDACRAIVARQGRCATGDAVITPGGRLKARWVVHTVGPVWRGDPQTDAVLARCWSRSLALAVEAGARSVAFPAISTGAYGYPMDRAARVSLGGLAAGLAAHPGAVDLVRVVLFHEADLRVWESQVAALYPRT